MRSFQQRLGEFEKRGIRVAVVSVDPPEASKRQAQKMGFSMPILSDANGEVVRKYGLLHPAGGPHKEDISRPAEFLIDSSATIRWVNITDSIGVRARPEQVLAAFDSLHITRD